MTKQNYTEFGQMVKELNDKPFKILLFPCNQFLGQEPSMPTKETMKRMSTQTLTEDSDKHIVLMDKVEVNGENSSPIFEFLKYNSSLYSEQKHAISPIPWNFAKFLVDQNGQVFKYYSPSVSPNAMIPDVQGLLNGSDSHKSRLSRRPTETLD